MASSEISLFAYEAAEQKKEKAPGALRTISEASEILDVPQHVLRFWETKFAQIKPLKRNGGRRFYRPQDIDILQQIKHLLYNQGYTIKGAKKAVDEFIQARSQRDVSTADWIAAIPPASVNDNFVDAAPQTLEVVEVQELELFQAPVEVAAPAKREELSALRAELSALRDALRMRIPTAGATAH